MYLEEKYNGQKTFDKGCSTNLAMSLLEVNMTVCLPCFMFNMSKIGGCGGNTRKSLLLVWSAEFSGLIHSEIKINSNGWTLPGSLKWRISFINMDKKKTIFWMFYTVTSTRKIKSPSLFPSVYQCSH